MKKLLFIFLTFLAVNASAQIPYETSVFWQFLEGFQGGDSSTQNYLEYKNDFLLLKTDQRDAKILQARNELNDIGISTIFIDANGNGGFSIDSAGGQTVVKLRGGLFAHSYFLNSHFSIGRGGQTQDYGGNVDGAKFTVSDEREPGYGLWDANNYQMMLQSSKDSIGGYVGLAFTSESATQDRNVGGFINYRKTGNNGRGELHFGTKTTTGSLADGIHAMKIYDGSVTIDSTILLPNLYTGTSDTSLVISNDTVYKRVLPSGGGAAKTIFVNTSNDIVNASSSENAGIAGNTLYTPSDIFRTYISSAGVFKNAAIYTSGQPASGSLVITLLVNGVASSLSITVPANGAGYYANTTDNVSISAGDYVEWQLSNNATTPSSRTRTISVEFQFD